MSCYLSVGNTTFVSDTLLNRKTILKQKNQTLASILVPQQLHYLFESQGNIKTEKSNFCLCFSSPTAKLF